ncbi:upstream stimulatory factor 2-like [Varroa jacobsoni]|uniref:upstream stimulatory factor 2-like n=1 Tax=Varroa jacobsoni TaxID=62625 RepID=UPI000BF78266|nr:upstream stimulatory factor 2-like [Varroa jacobsoni]XP_022710414.1 upstream stimulatory factor 2-like [Varroa jacobsoni]XP_022710415.1 upstream stimulatory factor 2-like [Varroa jacobsoni]XP_022710416.1 upstream stimulatory factor 2-like [Varroa jacobsoni]XP_022710417.1 upstream stimulatory factor 2-like [Varroa jacobsoni]
METFILEDTKPTQIGDDLTGSAQLLGPDGVTYRVVQVSGSDGTTVVAEGTTAVQVVGSTNGVFQTNAPLTDALATTPTGPFYVMMAPTENAAVITTASQRAIMPSKNSSATFTSPTASTTRITKTMARDERRRATHNEVERRRRDKINLWILRLSRIIPDCNLNSESPQGANKTQSLQSKGIILSKACDYINELKEKADKSHQLIKENEQLQMEVSDWRAKYESAVHEIQMLKDILSQQGIQFNIFRDTTMGPGTQQPTTPTGESGGSYDESVLDD